MQKTNNQQQQQQYKRQRFSKGQWRQILRSIEAEKGFISTHDLLPYSSGKIENAYQKANWLVRQGLLFSNGKRPAFYYTTPIKALPASKIRYLKLTMANPPVTYSGDYSIVAKQGNLCVQQLQTLPHSTFSEHSLRMQRTTPKLPNTQKTKNVN